jgi:hypothetical protein
MRNRRSFAAILVVLLAAACSGGGSESSPIGGANLPPDLVVARARIDEPFRFAELALRTAQNLGIGRVADRAGTETTVNLHPDGNQLVFARERDPGDSDSRELFVASIDGSRDEVRLTQNAVRDDEPCWSVDGTQIVFTRATAAGARLWAIAGDGSDLGERVAAPSGAADGQVAIAPTSGRLVWSRRGADGEHTLWLAGADGLGSVPLTFPLGGGPGSGDHRPTWAPDETWLVFVRRLASSTAVLARYTFATGAVENLLGPFAAVDWPRVTPDATRILFGVAEPEVGRGTLRLAATTVAAPAAVLLWPDARWRLEGLAVLPNLPATPLAAAPQTLDVTRVNLQIASGSAAFGSREQLTDADGFEYAVTTATFDGREVAGVNLRFDVPVATPTDLLEVRVRILARATRAGGDSVLRSSLYNPVDERFDTVVELPITTTTAKTLAFTTASLRHLTSERQLRFTIIADLPAGDRADLRIDQVEVVTVARSPN